MDSSRISSPLRTAVYIRVSSEEQAKHGDSLRDQTESCLHYIDTHENLILQDTYMDEGISGQKPDRDAFTRLMEAVENDQIDFILFTKLDRWFRSLRHYLNTQDVLDRHRVAWLAVDQPYFDTSTPFGRAFVNQSMTWAELEAQNGATRIKDVFANKVANGEVITGKTPLGFRIENKHLIPDENARIARTAFQHYLKYNSLHKTLRMLSDDFGIFMSIQNLRESVLKNTKYIGVYRDNKNYCPRLVDDETFYQVQALLKQNIPASQKYTYLFSGLLYCESCGRKMTSGHIHVKSTRKGIVRRYRYPSYSCPGHARRAGCPNGGEIRESRIEEYLLNHLGQRLLGCTATYKKNDIPRADSRIKRRNLQNKISRLKDLYLAEAITLDELKRYRTEYLEQLAAVPSDTEPIRDLSRLEHLLSMDFETVYASFDNEEKRRFWRSVIREIHISKSRDKKRDYRILFK
ncbi:MAG: recombinase family protein [Lachnospiraceae bacterium]|nr:recombinase family protein [Lachnospiraceae bacterium]